ncbi:MAG: hypothetical protein KHY19_06925 [Coprobacillus cateniformis]|nr:hypothetical protein [Coprobacillus cateniformis]
MSNISIKINGAVLPAPSSYEVNFEDLDSDQSKRYVKTGKMRRKRIRSEVMKISLSYNLKDMPDIMKIMRMIKPETYSVELYLPNEGISGTLIMYSNKKKFNYINTVTGHKAQSFSFDMTEV